MKRYRYDKELGEVVEVPSDEVLEQIHCGTSYGRETLDYMKRNNLVPPSDFKNYWEKKAAERVASKLPANTAEWKKERKQAIIESIKKVEAGYRPHTRRLSELGKG